MPTHAVSLLRIRHLLLLDALERTGSLRRAAIEIGVAQPAAVALIDDLEHALRAQLVMRDHTGTTLTPTGHAVVARARLAIQDISEAQEMALLTHSAAGRLRIGASPYLISALLPDVVRRLRDEVPGIELDVTEGPLDSLSGQLIDGHLDAIVASVDRSTVLSSAVKLEAVFLGVEPMFVVAGAGHPAFGKSRTSLDDVLAGPWVLPHTTSHVRTLVDTAVYDLGRPPVVPAVECRGILNVMGIAAAAGLLTVAPRSEISRAAWTDRIHVVRSPLRLRPPPYAIVNRRYTQHLPQLAVLRRCVKASLTALMGRG